jgi:hypothetical protein
MTHTPERIALRMQWLAYQASRPVGLGFLHFNADKTEDDIKPFVSTTNWDGVTGWHSDYIFGRMMKCSACFRGDQLAEVAPHNQPHPDYQSWAGKYPTYQALYDAALESLKESQ